MQFTDWLIFALKLEAELVTCLPSLTKGQQVQLDNRHFFIPACWRRGLSGLGGGTRARINNSRRDDILGFLYATIGGCGNTSFKYGSLTITSQEDFMIFEMEGRAGWKSRAKTTLSVGFFSTLFKASSLGILLALKIADSITLGW